MEQSSAGAQCEGPGGTNLQTGAKEPTEFRDLRNKKRIKLDPLRTRSTVGGRLKSNENSEDVTVSAHGE